MCTRDPIHYAAIIGTTVLLSCSLDLARSIPCKTKADCPALHDCRQSSCVPLNDAASISDAAQIGDLRGQKDLYQPADADAQLADISEACSDGTLRGQCSSIKPKFCEGGIFVDRCVGPDGVLGNDDDCGCPTGMTCRPDGTCCSPDCVGKDCGGDGCGGTCGTCDGFPCEGNTPICRNGVCSGCQCPNNCYDVDGYCGQPGGVLKDCYLQTPTPTNNNYCFCTVECPTGSPKPLVIGDRADPATGDC